MESPQGIESTVATHVVGPFLLTNLLLDTMRRSTPARVITMSSGGMYSAGVSAHQLQMDATGYNGTTQRKVKQFMLSGAYNAGFSTGLMAKDVRTALEIAQAMGTSTILAKPTADIWDDMEKQMGFLSDHTEMHKFTNKNK